MIAVKNAAELDKMRLSCSIVGDALKFIEQYVKAGVSTIELDCLIEQFIRDRGAIPSFLNYNGFPNSACISIDEVVVHGIPGKRLLKEGEIVSIDVGAKLNGFHGDAARTFAVGEVSPLKQKLIDAAKESFFVGIKEVKAGRRLGDLSHAIQTYVESQGFGVVREMVGHGIGRKLHEDPNVPNFGAAGVGPMLQAGNCLAIEPMITMGDFRIEIDRGDGWTCRTRDLSPAAHYENTVIVTDSGVEILTI